jgi:glucose-6-phosphate 1-dehydrogenase
LPTGLSRNYYINRGKDYPSELFYPGRHYSLRRLEIFSQTDRQEAREVTVVVPRLLPSSEISLDFEERTSEIESVQEYLDAYWAYQQLLDEEQKESLLFERLLREAVTQGRLRVEYTD